MNNGRILVAVLNKWAQPFIKELLKNSVQSSSIVKAIQNKVINSGWVSPNWSLFAELSPLMESVTGNIVAPMISKYVSQIDDASIPKMAHGIVDNAIKNGELSLFEGKVVFEESDLKQLKRLLELNLPYNPAEDIIIKTE